MSDEAYEAVVEQNRSLRRYNLLLVLLFFGPTAAMVAGAYFGAWYYVVVTLAEGTYFGSFHYLGDVRDRYLEWAALYLIPFSLVVFVWWSWFAIRSRRPKPSVSPPPSFPNRLTYALLLAFLLTFVWPPIVMASAYFLFAGNPVDADQGNDLAGQSLVLNILITAGVVSVLLFLSNAVMRYSRRSLGIDAR